MSHERNTAALLAKHLRGTLRGNARVVLMCVTPRLSFSLMTCATGVNKSCALTSKPGFCHCCVSSVKTHIRHSRNNQLSFPLPVPHALSSQCLPRTQRHHLQPFSSPIQTPIVIFCLFAVRAFAHLTFKSRSASSRTSMVL